MEIKTTKQILDDWDNQTGNPPYKLTEKKWVSFNELIENIDNRIKYLQKSKTFEEELIELENLRGEILA